MVRVSKTRAPIPARFTSTKDGGRIQSEWDIAVHPNSRIYAKMVVFRTRRDLRDFWKAAVNPKTRLGLDCQGVVTCLCDLVILKGGKTFAQADPKYFCLMGFAVNDMDNEVIVHEAVHAAMFYNDRMRRNVWLDYARNDHHEQIAYPAGIIANAIMQIVTRIRK